MKLRSPTRASSNLWFLESSECSILPYAHTQPPVPSNLEQKHKTFCHLRSSQNEMPIPSSKHQF